MDRQQLRDRLQLDDDSIIDEQVNPVSELDPHPVVNERKRMLDEHAESSLAKFVRQAGFVGALQEARAQGIKGSESLNGSTNRSMTLTP